MSKSSNKDTEKEQDHHISQIRELSLSLLDQRERLIMWARKRHKN